MPHDYSQYDDNPNVELNYRAFCNDPDCNWENRRKKAGNIQKTKKHHEQKTGHSVKTEELGD